MKKLFPRLSALVTASAALCAAEALAANVGHLAAVSNVSFTQNAEQDVIVTYDLANNGEPAFVTMDVLTNGVPLPVAAVQTVSGDVSSSLTDFIADGTGKQIVWKARTDWKGNLTSNATVVVSAHYTNHLEGVYLRVDVTGGTTAESWPHHFGSVDPDVSSTAFLWDELWLKCVPAGTFLMGSPESELGRNVNEVQHPVTMKSFFVGVTPVTRRQWKNMGGSIQSLSDEGELGSVPAGKIRYTYGSASNTRCDTILARLNAKTGFSGFALPTEAQWEYACRADTQSAFNDGSPCDPGETSASYATSESLEDLAWYQGNAGTSQPMQPVATKKPNAWGLYDFHGNCWEFCRDKQRTYPSSAEADPCGEIPVVGDKCVIRGGSKDTPASGCRSARRNVSGAIGATGSSATDNRETNGARFVFEF